MVSKLTSLENKEILRKKMLVKSNPSRAQKVCDLGDKRADKFRLVYLTLGESFLLSFSPFIYFQDLLNGDSRKNTY